MKKLLFVLPFSALLSGACASASANGKGPDKPALNVPPPPPRIIEPAPEPMPEPVSELPAAPASSSPPASRPNRSRESTARPPANAEAKPPEPKPVDPPPPDPAPVTQPVQPPVQLRTPQTADAENAAKVIRATMDKASGLLRNVDYRQLTRIRQKAYDDAMRFLQQADAAIKQGNLEFAQGVANKAEALARELAGR